MFKIEDILNLLPKEEAQKIAPKYYSNIVVALENKENTKEIFTMLAENGLTFKTATDIRILASDAKILKAAVEAWKSSGHIKFIENSISYLRYKSDILLSRISTCESVGKSYVDTEGNLQSFIINDDEWIEVQKGLNISPEEDNRETIDKSFVDKSAEIEAAMMAEEAELTAENFDRYTELTNVYNNVIKSTGGYVDNYEIGETYIKNLITYTQLSDNEIIKATLIGSGYVSSEPIDSIDEVIDSCLKETNGVGGRR